MNNTTKPGRNYANEWKQVGALHIHKYSIISTDRVIYAVFEASALMGRHGSLMSRDGFGWLGQIGSRSLPAEIDAIPVRVADGKWNQARFDAIGAWRAANDAEAYAAIEAAFPETIGCERRNGEIEGSL